MSVPGHLSGVTDRFVCVWADWTLNSSTRVPFFYLPYDQIPHFKARLNQWAALGSLHTRIYFASVILLFSRCFSFSSFKGNLWEGEGTSQESLQAWIGAQVGRGGKVPAFQPLCTGLTSASWQRLTYRKEVKQTDIPVRNPPDTRATAL